MSLRTGYRPNFVTATDLVQLSERGFVSGLGAAIGALHDHQRSTAYNHSVAAYRDLQTRYNQLHAGSMRLADEYEHAVARAERAEAQNIQLRKLLLGVP